MIFDEAQLDIEAMTFDVVKLGTQPYGRPLEVSLNDGGCPKPGHRYFLAKPEWYDHYHPIQFYRTDDCVLPSEYKGRYDLVVVEMVQLIRGSNQIFLSYV